MADDLDWELGAFGVWEHSDCPECDRNKQRATELGKSTLRKFVGLGFAVTGISVAVSSPEVFGAGMLFSIPASYLWAKAELEE